MAVWELNHKTLCLASVIHDCRIIFATTGIAGCRGQVAILQQFWPPENTDTMPVLQICDRGFVIFFPKPSRRRGTWSILVTQGSPEERRSREGQDLADIATTLKHGLSSPCPPETVVFQAFRAASFWSCRESWHRECSWSFNCDDAKQIRKSAPLLHSGKWGWNKFRILDFSRISYANLDQE